jgi:hypothetical protein
MAQSGLHVNRKREGSDRAGMKIGREGVMGPPCIAPARWCSTPSPSPTAPATLSLSLLRRPPPLSPPLSIRPSLRPSFPLPRSLSFVNTPPSTQGTRRAIYPGSRTTVYQQPAGPLAHVLERFTSMRRARKPARSASPPPRPDAPRPILRRSRALPSGTKRAAALVGPARAGGGHLS